MQPCAIAVFARAPVPGQAKTRLIPLLGAAGSARLQAQLIERSLATACAVPGCSVWLWATGAADRLPAAALVAPVSLHAQQGHDLGQRMAHAAQTMLATAQRVLIIGTDCPALTCAHLAQAFDALARCDVVLIPAEDGGYVLIGLSSPQPALFADIAWGGPTVLAATLQRCAAAGLRHVLLPSLPDLDTPQDYRRAQRAGWL